MKMNSAAKKSKCAKCNKHFFHKEGQIHIISAHRGENENFDEQVVKALMTITCQRLKYQPTS